MIQSAIGYCGIVELFGIAVAIGHFMVETLVIISLYKFYALILHTDVVTIRSGISAIAVANHPVIIYYHTVQAVQRLAERVFGIWIECTFVDVPKQTINGDEDHYQDQEELFPVHEKACFK